MRVALDWLRECIKSRDQSRDLGVVSIHNVKTHMTSDDVIVSGVESIVFLGDGVVHIRQVKVSWRRWF